MPLYIIIKYDEVRLHELKLLNLASSLIIIIILKYELLLIIILNNDNATT